MLIGTLYSHLADSYMGLANTNPNPTLTARPTIISPSTPRPSSSSSPSSNRSRNSKIAKAELYIDRAREHFKRAAYLDGECEQVMKKAIIAKLRGDEKVAEEWAMKHNAIWEEGVKANDG
jgi:anaphase-promoting complex subunit 5